MSEMNAKQADFIGYHNTVPEHEPERVIYQESAERQESRILHFWRTEAPAREFSPEQLNILAFNSSVPLTSVRRAITNLTNAGYLEKTGNTVPGFYGRAVNTWRLKGGE